MGIETKEVLKRTLFEDSRPTVLFIPHAEIMVSFHLGIPDCVWTAICWCVGLDNKQVAFVKVEAICLA